MLGILLAIILIGTLFTTFVTHYILLSSIIDYSARYHRAPTGRELIITALKPLVIILPLVFLVLAAIVIFISHRIAGPLHRLKMFMSKVGQGDLSVKLSFRNYDAIHDVADCFNEMVENLRKGKDEIPKKNISDK